MSEANDMVVIRFIEDALIGGNAALLADPA
jgi:hypothetical protein